MIRHFCESVISTNWVVHEVFSAHISPNSWNTASKHLFSLQVRSSWISVWFLFLFSKSGSYSGIYTYMLSGVLEWTFCMTFILDIHYWMTAWVQIYCKWLTIAIPLNFTVGSFLDCCISMGATLEGDHGSSITQFITLMSSVMVLFEFK